MGGILYICHVFLGFFYMLLRKSVGLSLSVFFFFEKYRNHTLRNEVTYQQK